MVQPSPVQPIPLTDEEHNLRVVGQAVGYHRWIFDQFAAHLHDVNVLEVGAGIGTITQFLVAAGCRVTATDINPVNLEELRRRFPDVTAVQDDILHSTLTGQFDRVVSINMLEHLEDDRTALRAMRDWLAPDGALLLLVPAMQGAFGTLDEAVHHYRRYDKHDLRDKLTAAGFTIRSLYYMNWLGLLGWYWAGRIVKRRIIQENAMGAFDLLVRLLQALERPLHPPFGLSLIAIAEPRREER